MGKKRGFHSQTLSNGLRVIFEERNIPVISTIAASRFGSGFETEKLKGIAHFIEHSVFKGTKTRDAREISKEIEKKGGEWNAFTAEEETAFWIKLGAEHIESSIDIISDIMLDPAFNIKDIEIERGVILEEIKMYHDLPQYYVLDRLKESLFNRPFGLSALGTREIIGKVPIEVLRKNHHRFYDPSNIVLVYVGKADFEDIVALTGKHFSRKSKKIRFNHEISIAEGSFSKITEKRKSIDQAQLALGFHMPSRLDKRRYAAEVFNAYLGEGMSSPLFQEIREKRGLAYSVRSILEQGRNYGYSAITVGTVKEKLPDIKRMILKEIKRTGILKSRDFEETKEQLIGKYEINTENSMRTAQALLYEELTEGAEEHYKYPERISSVNISDVRKLSKIKEYGSVEVVPE